jgi:hypothetical protein
MPVSKQRTRRQRPAGRRTRRRRVQQRGGAMAASLRDWLSAADISNTGSYRDPALVFDPTANEAGFIIKDDTATINPLLRVGVDIRKLINYIEGPDNGLLAILLNPEYRDKSAIDTVFLQAAKLSSTRDVEDPAYIEYTHLKELEIALRKAAAKDTNIDLMDQGVYPLYIFGLFINNRYKRTALPLLITQ